MDKITSFMCQKILEYENELEFKKQHKLSIRSTSKKLLAANLIMKEIKGEDAEGRFHARLFLANAGIHLTSETQ